MTENDIPTKLLWVDLEMTGLDPAKQRIIEVAALVTDFNFVELDRFEMIIHQPEEVLQAAEDWPKENMKELFDLVRKSEHHEEDVIDAFCDFIKTNFGDERAVLAGNSIHQDRRFIRQWWTQVDNLLHYRMFDVSTLKMWIQGTMQKEFIKGDSHRALDDIQESIDEFRWSLEQLAAQNNE